MTDETTSDETMSAETKTDDVTTGDGVAEDIDTQSPTASAPDRSTGDTTTGGGAAEEDSLRARRKVREGVVVSSGMDKTAVITVIERVRHPKYNKFVLQTKRLYAHDEANDVNVGDRVRVMETRPLSKTKRWRVTDVLERAK